MNAPRQNRRPTGTPVTDEDRAAFARQREALRRANISPPNPDAPAVARIPPGTRLPQINLPPDIQQQFESHQFTPPPIMHPDQAMTAGVGTPIQSYPPQPYVQNGSNPNVQNGSNPNVQNGTNPNIQNSGFYIPNIPQDAGPGPIPKLDTRTLKPPDKEGGKMPFIRDPGLLDAMERKSRTLIQPKSDVLGLREEGKRPNGLAKGYEKFFPLSDNFWYPPDTQIWIRPLAMGDLSAFSKAIMTDNNTLLLDAMGATISGFDVRDLVPEDYHGLIFWHRFHSFPRTPVTFKWDSIYGVRAQPGLMERSLLKETNIRSAMGEHVEEFRQLKAKGYRQRTLGDVETLTNLGLAAGTPGYEWVDESVLWEAEMSTHLSPSLVDDYDIQLPAEQEAFASLFKRVAVLDTLDAETFVAIQRIQSLEYGISEAVVVRLDPSKMPPFEVVKATLESLRDRLEPTEPLHIRAVSELERLELCKTSGKPFLPMDEEVSLPITARSFFPAIY